MSQLIPLIAFAVFLVVGYISGSITERRHFASLREREADTRDMVVITFPTPPSDWTLHDPTLVCGSVVISLDYFKRFLAGLKTLVGGRITPYEPLLDRARREALMRMKQTARARGYATVINVRLETSCLSRASSEKSVAGVEVLAFGTAVNRGS